MDKKAKQENHETNQSCDINGCSPCENGTNNLLLGTGVGVYGAASFLATGAVCPTCLVIAPANCGRAPYNG